jgi:hypothetical protein
LELSKALRTLKNASKLRKKTNKGALIMSIKWGSMFAMINRYLAIADKPGECGFENDVIELISTRVEHARIVELRTHLKELECVSMLLQKDGAEQLNLSEVRDQFDILVVNYPDTAEYLSADADVVHNSTFEKGIAKIQNGMESTLNRSEKKRQFRDF